VAFRVGGREIPAVEDVGFTLATGETLALVGESGCGKSVTALALMRLLPPSARLLGGIAELSGVDLLGLPEKEMRRRRGQELAMVFQEPMTSFDPVYRLGEQLLEAIYAHEDVSYPVAYNRVEESLAAVGLPDPAGIIRRYPHELSGGMKQRAMIAMALLENPGLILCDEPTTALDVTIQAQIMELLARLRDERGLSLLFITHNLGLVAGFAHRVAVMYAGSIVEVATVEDLYSQPSHPYTIGLFASVPRLEGGKGRLVPIPGVVPPLGDFPPGCKFANRCRRVAQLCREKRPELADLGNTHAVACHFPGGDDDRTG
jgi:oligopeptide/dipeptide ABC transporter ATP-binding protein